MYRFAQDEARRTFVEQVEGKGVRNLKEAERVAHAPCARCQKAIGVNAAFYKVDDRLYHATCAREAV